MLKIKKNKIFVIIILLFFLAPKELFALSLVIDEQKYIIDEKDLETFVGKSSYYLANQLKKPKLSTKDLSEFLGTKALTLENTYETDYKIDKIYKYLNNFSKNINIAPQEPILKIENNIATFFTPPKDGLFLDVFSSAFSVLDALKQNQKEISLKVEKKIPTKTLKETNILGINELIARGESNFQGSPKNRIHNIKVGVGKMKGIIILPEEEFSFNKYLGPVEEEQGFLPELVIKKTGTVPELGGGLCQVSSTVFRTAMQAGLPITQRKNHSYAVQYYSPQGTDATIYPGVIDLKFINDTENAILIWPYFKDTYKLVFEFYGTKDTRNVILQKPTQYDRKPDGSMKAEWTRSVEKNGQTSTTTFKSIYLPPELFHKTETYPTTSPETNL